MGPRGLILATLTVVLFTSSAAGLGGAARLGGAATLGGVVPPRLGGVAPPPVAWTLTLPGAGAFNVNGSVGDGSTISSGATSGALLVVALVSGDAPNIATVYAVNTTSGSLAWVSPPVAAPLPGGRLLLTLSADGAVAMLAVSLNSQRSPPALGGFFGFSLATGALLWSRPDLDAQQLYSFSSFGGTIGGGPGGLPAAHGSGFVAYARDVSGAYALFKLAANGTSVWVQSQFAASSLYNADVTVDGSRVVGYASATPGAVVISLDAASGGVLWSRPMPYLGYTGSLMSATTLSILGGPLGARMNLTTVALADGALTLRATTIVGSTVPFGVSMLPVGGGGQIVASLGNTTYLLDALGVVRWSFTPSDGSLITATSTSANTSLIYCGSTFDPSAPLPPNTTTALTRALDATTGAPVASAPGLPGATSVLFVFPPTALASGWASSANGQAVAYGFASPGVTSNVSLFLVGFDTVSLVPLWSIESQFYDFSSGATTVTSYSFALSPGPGLVVGAALSAGNATRIVAYDASPPPPPPAPGGGGGSAAGGPSTTTVALSAAIPAAAVVALGAALATGRLRCRAAAGRARERDHFERVRPLLRQRPDGRVVKQKEGAR